MLRAGIGALIPKLYSGVSFFEGLLRALARFHEQAQFVVLSADGETPVPTGTSNIRVVRCNVPRFGAGWSRVIWEQIMLPRILATLDVDVYYSSTNQAVLRSSRPCVIHVHNMEPLVPIPSGMPLPLRMRLHLLRLLTRLSLKSAKQVVAASNLVKNTVIAMGCPADKVEVIYHGIDDLEPPEAQSARTGGYVAAAAKFVRYANLEILIRGFARARELGYGGELRFAGGPHDDHYEAEIKELVYRLGVASYVRFLGYIPRSEVLALMRDCDAFLFPSRLEACPFTMLEAMHQRAPIIATTAAPMPEFGSDAAIYVEPSDYQAFGDAVYRVTSSPQLQSTLRAKASARAADFRWDKTVRQLLEVLNRAACGS